jgi:hypothetical protein
VCYGFLKPCDCPQQLDCFKGLEEDLAFAKKNNKPVMLDFYGLRLCELPQNGRKRMIGIGSLSLFKR